METHIQAGKFEKSLRKRLVPCGHALQELIRGSTESYHWPDGLERGDRQERSVLGTAMKPE